MEESVTQPDTKLVDNMAPVLDRLDLEYEEELLNKTKKTAIKRSKTQREPRTPIQQRGSSGKKNSLDQITNTKRALKESPATSAKSSTKKPKTELPPKKKKVESNPQLIDAEK